MSAEPHKVAQSFTLLYRRVLLCNRFGFLEHLADCKSAIRQSETLRYDFGCPCQALLHRHSSGAAHTRAFTGLCTT
jgi:hypothetical protein